MTQSSPYKSRPSYKYIIIAAASKRQLSFTYMIAIVLGKTTMSGEGEVEMASWEATVTEFYQLYSACKKRESRAVNNIIQELKKRNVKFKLIVGDGTTTLH
jgi:hypothetical protein